MLPMQRIFVFAICMMFWQGCINSLAYRFSVHRGYAMADLYPGTKYNIEFISGVSPETRNKSVKEFKNPITWIVAPVFVGVDFVVDTLFLPVDLAFYDYSGQRIPALTPQGERVYTFCCSKESLFERSNQNRIELQLEINRGYIDFVGARKLKRVMLWNDFARFDGKKNLRLIPPTYTPDSWHSGSAECTWLMTEVGSDEILGYAVAMRLSEDCNGELTIRQMRELGDFKYVITNGTLHLSRAWTVGHYHE